ncbi:four-carbon acid sugar kinase family protein [Arthrobacter sp. Br18]|uniref:four-carbon acid sugar kinase family protein n=1 Tax=Arthrobacter sp. Br18 TaxID=1312954 RepID=UPI00047C9581|nr:four-carbon acid sugar kinase family protein [Arthrobacter sp. Br18]
MITESELLSGFPAENAVDPRTVAASVAASRRVLVVLDDDPTGTQSVADLPVLTSWEAADFAWAFTFRIAGAAAPAVYVLTNTRSLGPDEAAARNREAVTNALAAAEDSGIALGFVSRSDSTLRGHYPLEPDVIAATLSEVTGQSTDGVVIVPAFPDAGRITIGGIHYMRDGAGGLIPVAATEFASDATFGYSWSELARYVEEKSAGRFPAADVIVLDLAVVRGGTEGIAEAIAPAADSAPIVADIVTENDLRALALGLAEAESRGKKLLYRVGPPFVRARIGQREREALTAEEVFPAGSPASRTGGLVVVGSHVGVTTRQLAALTTRHPNATTVELAVEDLLDEARAGDQLERTVAAVVAALGTGDVILSTSRLLVKSEDPAESLRIARVVSAGVVAVVRRTLAAAPPRFVVAKGGITSSDVAAHGLAIRHAVVRGPMLPGIVSLWEPVDGPARGIPFVVFAGNVGDDDSLLDVVRKLSTTFQR